jgi:hypothetical protein
MKRAALWLALVPVIAGPGIAAFADTAAPSTPSTSTTAPSDPTTTAQAPSAPSAPDAGTSAPTSTTSQTGSAPADSSGSASTDPSSQTTTAAPPGSAEATAVGVVGAIAIGHTKANAGPSSASATGNAVEVGGNALIGGTTGGDASGNKQAHGALLDTGQTPLGMLMLTPWAASSSTTSDGSTASSDAALARLNVIDPKTLAVNVFQSHSDASYSNTEGSKGSSSSDGATVDLGNGQLFIDLLHSEASSQNKGSSYIASINGNQIGTNNDANGQCVIDASPLLKLTCLSASGGAGTPLSSASVGTLEIAPGQGPTGVVSDVTSTGTPAAAPASTRVLGEKVPNTSPSNANTGNAASTGKLPFTGLNVAGITAYAMFLIGLGVALLRIRRRQRATV